MLKSFKKLVDENNATIAEFVNDHKRVAESLGINTSRGFGGAQITGLLAESINSNIANKSDRNALTRVRFGKIAQELIYRHILYGDDISEYLKVFKIITECLKSGLTKLEGFDNAIIWSTIIQQAKNYALYTNRVSPFSLDLIKREYPKIVDTALAVKLLNENGASVAIADSEFELSGLEGIVQRIEDEISKVGGISMANILFRNLLMEKVYNESLERYVITRNTNISGISSPMFPYGYMLNLCVKYPTESKRKEIPGSELTPILELATAIATSYGTQPYSFWEVKFHDGDRLIELLQETALFDSIFTISQAKPKYVLDLCKGLFNWVELQKFETVTGFSLDEYYHVCSIIFDLSQTFLGPVIVYQSKICALSKSIAPERISSILGCISHDSANADFKIPSDLTKADFLFKPLIRIGPTKFVLMDKSWCAPGFYEALFAILNKTVYPSKNNDKVSNQLGSAFETLIYEKLKSSNISFTEGEYKNGECDLIIESAKSVILIEFKRKVLTRLAKSGDDISLLLDIAGSIFDAQFQLGRTHLLLSQNGFVDLKDRSGKPYKVTLNGREVERIALSSVEFGGFHDKTIVEQILRAFSTHNYSTSSSDQKIKSKFAEFNLKQSEWNKQLDELVKWDARFSHRPFWNCSFLSYFQLLTVLDDSSDNESFHNNLFSTKYVTTGSFDFYREYLLRKKAEVSLKEKPSQV